MADLYPMAEKWGKVHSEASAILQFQEWLESLDKSEEQYDNMHFIDFVYLYYDIDPKQLEDERRAMLKALQS